MIRNMFCRMPKILIALLLIQILIQPVQAQRVRQLNEATSPGVKRNQLQLLSPESKANLIFRILEKRLASLAKRVEKLNARVQRSIDRLETSEANVTKFKNDLKTLNAQLTEIEADIDQVKTDWEAYLNSPDKVKYSAVRTQLNKMVEKMKNIIAAEKKLLQQLKKYTLREVKEKTASPSPL